MGANEARALVGVPASVIIAVQASPLGDTIGEERGLRASLRSRPGVSARDPRGGVCENNRREADSRFNAGQKTGHYCPENICPMHQYPTLRAFMPAAVYTLIIH